MSSESGSAGTGALRILVAEDQAIIRLDLRGILEKHGLIVCAEARDGEEAVELARTSHPDVALLDMRMPRLDGIEAARRMYAERPIPIVMLTAFSDRAVVEKAIAAGVFAYLVKPFKESDLVPAIRAAVIRHAELLTARRAVGEKPLRPVVISVRSPTGNEWPPLRIERTEDGGVDVQPIDVRADAEAGRAVRVLVGEDETLIRLDLKAMLERAGFDVCAEARDGLEALELARSEEPDLAVLDVKMPRLDGIEAARRMLDERPIPIVIVSAFTERSLVSRAADAGVFGYLAKPFRENDLLPAIATAQARFGELAAVRDQVESLADALAARKAIERAKGILMEKQALSEDAAFARLRKASQVSGRPMRVIAEAVIETFSA